MGRHLQSSGVDPLAPTVHPEGQSAVDQCLVIVKSGQAAADQVGRCWDRQEQRPQHVVLSKDEVRDQQRQGDQGPQAPAYEPAADGEPQDVHGVTRLHVGRERELFVQGAPP